MNNHLFILLSALIMLGCQPSHKTAHLKDPIYGFLQNELGEVERALQSVESSLAEMDLSGQDHDDISNPTIKKAALRSHYFKLRKEHTFLEQERIYLSLSAHKRAVEVQKRTLAGAKLDASGEFEEFKLRYKKGYVPRGTF